MSSSCDKVLAVICHFQIYLAPGVVLKYDPPPWYISSLGLAPSQNLIIWYILHETTCSTWLYGVFMSVEDEYYMHSFIMLSKASLTHWGRVTHICVGNLIIIGSDNGLSPGRCQAIIWTNAGILLIGPLGTNFSEILIEILIFSFKKMCLKVSSAKRRPFCLGLNVLMHMVTFYWNDL